MRKISSKQYAQSLYQAIKDKKFSDRQRIFDNFLHLIRNNKDCKNLGKIIRSFERVYLQNENEAEVTITSARTLTDGLLENLNRFLTQKTGKKVILKTAVDESLIGGLIIQEDDVILDGSLKNQLLHLKNKLVN